MDVKVRLVYKFNHVLTTYNHESSVGTEHCNVVQFHNRGSVYFITP